MGIEIQCESDLPRRQYQCDVCGVTRSKRSLMEAHVLCHSDSPAGFTVIGKDQRRYNCSFCGIVRSKLSLLRKHLLTHVSKANEASEMEHVPQAIESKKKKHFDCEECGLQVKRLSTLRQHLLVHMTQKPFVCPRDGCVKRYKRRDHLNRHLLQHEKKFQCSRSGCNMLCCTKSNLQRHLRRHQLKGILQRGRSKYMCEQEKLKCPEPNCPKIFSYRCRVQSHYEIAHAFRYSEILCGEPGCGQIFSEASDLSAHIWDSHRVVNCEQCGVPIARKSYKRHLMGHEPNQIKCRLQCSFKDCSRSFTKSSNLGLHIKVAHMGARDHKCTKANCGKVFGYKHTRDNHEKTRLHCYLQGDFLEEDLKFRSQPRGGRKPASLYKVDDLYRKRIIGPKQGEKVIGTGCGMD